MICRVTSKVKLESGKWYQRKSLNGKGIECEPLLYLDCEGISTGFYRKDSSTFYDKWWLARACNKGYESSLQRRKCGLRYADTV